jgi:membrane protease YdiL (CAAX protease family)
MLIGLAYLVCLTIVELMGVGIGPVVAVVGHAGLILALFILYLFKPDGHAQPVWLGLILVSLLRIVSLTLPLNLIHPLIWPAVICLPVWVAIGVLRPYLGLSNTDLGLRKAHPVWQALIALSGLPAGYLGNRLLDAPPYFPEFSWLGLFLGGSLLLLSVAFTEELLFRGLLLPLAQRALGVPARPCVSAVYAAMYVGSQSPAYLIGMALLGWFWGWCALRTRSIWGVVAAHALLVIGLGLFWPYFN